MLPMLTLLLPLDATLQHHFRQDFLFLLHPHITLIERSSFSHEALVGKGLFQRNPCGQSTLAAGGKRYEVNVKMRRFLVQMQMSRKYMEIGISLLK